MQAVIDLALNVIAALTLAVLAQLGVADDQSSDSPPSAERVVARSPQARAAPAKPQHAVDCPDTPVIAPITV